MRGSLLVVILAGATAGAAGAQGLPVAVERRLADAADLQVGDTLRVAADDDRSLPAHVAAIYEPGADPSTIMRREHHVRMELADLASLLGEPDRVDRFAVFLRPGVDADRAAVALNRGAFGFELLRSDSLAARSSTTFVVVSRFHRAIAIISILASTIFLLCLMLLKVEERRADVATLRLTGASRRSVFIVLMIESAMVTVVGTMIGVVLAIGASSVTNWHYQRMFDTPLLFSLLTTRSLALAVTLSVVFGLGAGAAAAAHLVRTEPLALWRRAQ